MFLFLVNNQADPVIGIAYIIGLLIPLVLASALGSLFIQLGIKLIAKKSVGFGKPFWISFCALAATFIVQILLRDLFDNISVSQNSNLRAIPAVIFLLVIVFGSVGLARGKTSPPNEN